MEKILEKLGIHFSGPLVVAKSIRWKESTLPKKENR